MEFIFSDTDSLIWGNYSCLWKRQWHPTPVLLLEKQWRTVEIWSSVDMNPKGPVKLKVLPDKTVMCLVIQSCPTLCDPTDCSPPGSSVHGDFPGKNTGVGCRALLQRIFTTQGSNPGLPHCKWILYRLSHQGSPQLVNIILALSQNLDCLMQQLLFALESIVS